MKIILKIMFLVLAWNSYGQNCSITGKVQDEKKRAVPYATVAFKNQQDSTKVFGTLTNDQGQFSIKVPQADYVLEVSMVGAKPFRKELSVRNKNQIDLGVLQIQTTVTLDEVVVTADNSQQISLDKKVYNISRETLVGGGSLIDVMQNIPSVQVELDGGVTIRGNGNVQILIDGKNSGITNTSTFLRTIPAGSIERIEVITNPSARYNAEGTGGIINVVLKKGRQRPLTSSFEVFGGIRLNSGANVNVSQGGGKFSWYANAGVGYSEPKYIRGNRVESLDETPSKTELYSEKVYNQFYSANNLGGQFNFNNNHQLDIDLTYRLAELNNDVFIDYEDYLGEALVSKFRRLDNQGLQTNLLRVSTNYHWKFNKQGGKLTIRLLGQRSAEDGNSTMTDELQIPVASILNVDRSMNTMQNTRYNLSADYVQPLNKHTRFELGAQYRNTEILNNFEVSRTAQGNTSTIPAFTDNTSYLESIYAAYFQFTKTFNKLKYQFGLRSETTNILIATENNTREQAINYTNWFPSAFVHYDFNKRHKIRLSASRRIRRPRLNALIPFSSFSDSRNVLVGNPSVNPAYVIVSELGYQGKLSNRLSITPSFFYSYTTNVMDYFIQKENITINNVPEEIFVRRTINIGVNHALGFELGVTYQVFDWFRMYGEVMVSGFQQTASYQEIDYSNSAMFMVGRLRLNFDISKTLKLQLQPRYVGRNPRGQFIRRAVYRLDVGISQQLFRKKATLSFNFKDVFNTWWFRVNTQGENFNQEIFAQVRRPQANLSFIYLLNQKKYKGKKGRQYDKF